MADEIKGHTQKAQSKESPVHCPATYGEAAAQLHNVCDDFAKDLPRFTLDLVHHLARPLARREAQGLAPY
jgi:hypothetical protein